jgi:hypothetical protein
LFLWPEIDLPASDAAATRLPDLGQSLCGRRSDKTATTKLKKVTDEDLRILEAHFEKHPSRHAGNIFRFLRLDRFVGLRPCGCRQATVTWDRRSDVLEFNVVNAKHDARREECSCSWSSTSRTARSRTSGENLFVVLLMVVLPAQELDPPANPVWFIPANPVRFNEPFAAALHGCRIQCARFALQTIPPPLPAEAGRSVATLAR